MTESLLGRVKRNIAETHEIAASLNTGEGATSNLNTKPLDQVAREARIKSIAESLAEATRPSDTVTKQVPKSLTLGKLE